MQSLVSHSRYISSDHSKPEKDPFSAAESAIAIQMERMRAAEAIAARDAIAQHLSLACKTIREKSAIIDTLRQQNKYLEDNLKEHTSSTWRLRLPVLASRPNLNSHLCRSGSTLCKVGRYEFKGREQQSERPSSVSHHHGRRAPQVRGSNRGSLTGMANRDVKHSLSLHRHVVISTALGDSFQDTRE
jgi:hypothetical protein